MSWLREWEGPEEPVLYLRSLVGKTLALGVWEERGREGRLLKDTLDLSELFHPDTFLNALRQQTARYSYVQTNRLYVCMCVVHMLAGQ